MSIRVTHYAVKSGEYTSTGYTLALEQDLEADYFVMMYAGPTASGRPEDQMARIDGDPFGNLGFTTGAAELRLLRIGTAAISWEGTVVVVECLSGQATSGFTLKEILEPSFAVLGISLTQTVVEALGVAHTSRTVPIGGPNGGGGATVADATEDRMTFGWTRKQLTGTADLTYTRYSGVFAIPAVVETTYIVEWGSEWTVQVAEIAALVAGGPGTATSDFATAAISSVVRDNTWMVLTAAGAADECSISAAGVSATLGDGVSQNATETTIAAGRAIVHALEPIAITAYIMEHASLAVDHVRRNPYAGGVVGSFTEAVDAALGTETYSSPSHADVTEGSRFALAYYVGGTSHTFAGMRAMGIALRPTASTTISLERHFPSVNVDFGGWLQSVDFENVFSGGQVTAVGLIVDALCTDCWSGVVTSVGLIVDAYARDIYDVRAVNLKASDLLERIRTEEARVRDLVSAGEASDLDLKGFLTAATGFRAEIKACRATIDTRDVRDALVYFDPADLIRLWQWERQLRSALVTVDAQLRVMQEIASELISHRPGRTYVTRSGDTLQSLSSRFFGSPDAWRRISDGNPDLDIGELEPGTVLNIPEGE